MFLTAPATVQGSWLLTEAQRRCDRAGERLGDAVALLRALDADCVWQARAIERMRDGLSHAEQDLIGLRSQLDDISRTLAVG